MNASPLHSRSGASDYDGGMSHELTRIRRHPLWTPLLLPMVAIGLAAAGIYWLGAWARTSIVVLLQPAEVQAEVVADPELSRAGARRVEALGAALEDLLAGRTVDYLYAADSRRSQQTAAPVANQFGLPVNLLAESDWPELARRIRWEHRGDTVVVVGYAKTIPQVVEALSGTQVVLSDAEYDTMFLLVKPSIGDAHVFRVRYQPPQKAQPAAAGSSKKRK